MPKNTQAHLPTTMSNLVSFEGQETHSGSDMTQPNSFSCSITSTPQPPAIEQKVHQATALPQKLITHILEHTTDSFFAVDHRWTVTSASPQMEQLIQPKRLGLQDSLLGKNIWDAWPEIIGSYFYQECHRALIELANLQFETYYQPLRRWFEVHTYSDSEGLLVCLQDITSIKQNQALLRAENQILEMIATGVALPKLLYELTKVIEEQSDEAQCSLLLISQDGKKLVDLVAPSLPADYQAAVKDGILIAPCSGSCGTAAYYRKPIIVKDVANDPLWAEWKHFPLRYGLQACWSTPILTSKGEVLGTFAMYYRTPRGPSLHDQQLVEASIYLARVAIKRQHSVSALNQSEERLRLALDAAGMGIWDWDLITNHVTWSSGHERLFGLPPGSFDGSYTTFATCIHPDDQAGVDEAIACAHREQRHYQHEYRVIWPDNSIHWIEGKGDFFYNEAGEAIRMAGTVVDISERKQAQEALRKSEERRLIAEQQARLEAEAANQVKQELNFELERQVEERTWQLNQSFTFEAMLKRITDKVRDSLDEAQILQAAVQELALALDVLYCNATQHDTNSEVIQIAHRYTDSRLTFRSAVLSILALPEIEQQLQQGLCFQFCTSICPLPYSRLTVLLCPIVGDQGVLGHLLLLAHADQGLNQLEIRLVQQVANQCAIAIRQARLYQAAQAQVAALEHLHQLKDDFLSTVSHELRSPVANMKMAIQMLNVTLNRTQGKNNGSDLLEGSRATEYLKILQQECEREISLINDLLDLQRLDAGAEFSKDDLIDLSVWLPPLVNSFQERARSCQQQLQVDLEDDLPQLISNADGLKRILAELLHNACKYTPPEAKILVGAHIDQGRMQLEIRNFGTEIPQQELAHIFEKFYRIPSADRWKQGGTGLGLALVKKLSEHLGGSIQVESASGQTCFKLELPIGQET